jgi:hypothetical protein
VEVKQRGKVLAYLTAVYALSEDPQIKREIELLIQKVGNGLSEDLYKELLKGYLESKIPLELLIKTSRLLPGQPILAKMPGRMPGLAIWTGETVSTIVGVNEAGKKLVNKMLEVLKELAKTEFENFKT